MARVARRSRRRGGTIPARSGRMDVGRVGLLTRTPLCRPSVDTRAGPASLRVQRRARIERGRSSVRRTAAVIAGALLLLTGCNDGAKSGSASGDSSSADAAPAQVAVSPVDGSADVSPVEPLEITVTGGKVG